MERTKRNAILSEWADKNHVYGVERELLVLELGVIRDEYERRAQEAVRCLPPIGYIPSRVRDDSEDLADVALFTDASIEWVYNSVKKRMMDFYRVAEKK